MIKFIQSIFKRLPAFSNVAEGTHAGNITRLLDGDVSTRHLLGKQGSQSGDIAICGTAELPLGVIADTGADGDAVNVCLLGNNASTMLMVASEAISAGEDVYTAASGRVQDQPAVAGTYYHVGRALSSAPASGTLLEVLPMTPRKVRVMEAFSGTPATDLNALATALEAAPDKLIMIAGA